MNISLTYRMRTATVIGLMMVTFVLARGSLFAEDLVPGTIRRVTGMNGVPFDCKYWEGADTFVTFSLSGPLVLVPANGDTPPVSFKLHDAQWIATYRDAAFVGMSESNKAASQMAWGQSVNIRNWVQVVQKGQTLAQPITLPVTDGEILACEIIDSSEESMRLCCLYPALDPDLEYPYELATHGLFSGSLLPHICWKFAIIDVADDQATLVESKFLNDGKAYGWYGGTMAAGTDTIAVFHDSRAIQIFDRQLNFQSRIESQGYANAVDMLPDGSKYVYTSGNTTIVIDVDSRRKIECEVFNVNDVKFLDENRLCTFGYDIRTFAIHENGLSLLSKTERSSTYHSAAFDKDFKHALGCREGALDLIEFVPRNGAGLESSAPRCMVTDLPDP